MSFLTLNDEISFLARAAGQRIDGRNLSEFERIIGRMRDWSGLRQAAAEHGMTSLLYLALTELRRYPAPSGFLDGLQREADENGRLNLFLLQYLIRLVDFLEEHDIDAFPYKGPLLADEVYGDPTLRPAGDIDLLIPRKSFDRAVSLLLSNGYHPQFRLSAGQTRAYMEHYRSFPLIWPEKGVMVDLHWDLARHFFPPMLTEMDYEKHLRPVILGGRSLHTLSREDLLIVLCLHGTKHRWQRMIWLADVAGLLALKGGMDWERVLEDSGRLGMRRALLLGLFLALDIFGSEMPEIVAAAIAREGAVVTLAGEIAMDVLQPEGRKRSLGEAVKKALFHLRSMDRPVDRLRYVFFWLLKPNVNDWRALSLPDNLFFLYYLLRPFRLLYHYSRRIIGRGFG